MTDDLERLEGLEADMREQAQGSQDGWLLRCADQLRERIRSLRGAVNDRDAVIEKCVDKSIVDAVLAEREACSAIVQAEEECDGDMPDELRMLPLEDVVRAAVRATKRNILDAIRSRPSPLDAPTSGEEKP